MFWDRLVSAWGDSIDQLKWSELKVSLLVTMKAIKSSIASLRGYYVFLGLLVAAHVVFFMGGFYQAVADDITFNMSYFGYKSFSKMSIYLPKGINLFYTLMGVVDVCLLILLFILQILSVRATLGVKSFSYYIRNTLSVLFLGFIKLLLVITSFILLGLMIAVSGFLPVPAIVKIALGGIVGLMYVVIAIMASFPIIYSAFYYLDSPKRFRDIFKGIWFSIKFFLFFLPVLLVIHLGSSLLIIFLIIPIFLISAIWLGIMLLINIKIISICFITAFVLFIGFSVSTFITLKFSLYSTYYTKFKHSHYKLLFGDAKGN